MNAAARMAIACAWLVTTAAAYLAGHRGPAAPAVIPSAVVKAAQRQSPPSTPLPCRRDERTIRIGDGEEADDDDERAPRWRPSEAAEWDASISRDWAPARIEQLVAEVVRDGGLVQPEVDCAEFPCVARFGPEVSDAERDATLGALQSRLGVTDPLCQMVSISASPAGAGGGDDGANQGESFQGVALAPAAAGDPDIEARCLYRLARWRNEAWAQMNDRR